MRPQGPTSWLISAQTDWRGFTATQESMSVSSTEGLSLAAAAGGPLALDDKFGTLGGLVVPRRMAVDGEGVVYLLGSDARIRRSDADAGEFRELPQVGGPGHEARQFDSPRSIAIAGRALAVCDSSRVQIFSLDSLALIEVIGGLQPTDVAAYEDSFYILSASGHVYRYRLYPGALERIARAENTLGRLAVDRKGRVYVLVVGPQLLVFDDDEKPAETIRDAGDVRDRFAAAPYRVDMSARFCLSPLPAPLDTPLAMCTAAFATKKQGPVIHRSTTGGGRTLIADSKSRRVWMFVDEPKKLRSTWGPWNAAGVSIALDSEDAWDPVDVAVAGDCAYILDRRHAIVWVQRSGRETLRQAFRDTQRENRWTRIAIDERGCVALLDSSATPPMTEIYSPLGVRLEARKFRYEDFADNRASLPTHARPPRVFTLDGAVVEPDFTSPDGTPIFAAAGEWVSKVFDSRLYRCSWHRVEIEFTDLPPGCSFALSTASSMVANAPGELVWDVAATGSLPAGQGPDEHGRYPFRTDCLVQSQEGQFLVLEVKLTGDRFRTPVLASMRTLYPRASLLQDLPAVYSADEQSRRFLERLLAALDVEFERLDESRRELPSLFDPSAVKPGAFMDYLAGWLGIVQESDWSAEQKRRLLVAAPGIRARRGRVDGLRDHLQAFLSALTGIEPGDVRQLGFPLLVEAFRERNFLRLRDGEASPLPQALPMWSASRTARLRLDEYARIGEADLVGTGDPVRDPFHEYAHRFRVYVPAAWVRNRKQESQLRRAIEAEKPAHTRYELCLIASRMQVGLQSTVGIDTIVGGLSPGNVLGRDALLHCARRRGATLEVGQESRIGVATQLM